MSPHENQPANLGRSAEFFSALATSCLHRIDRATVPIVGIQDDELRHDRTGVLYRIGGYHFVLTAAHDLREIVARKIPLFISVNVRGVEPMPLCCDARFHSTEVEGRDVAAILLPPDLALEVARYREFLPHSQINLNGIKRRTPYVFFGYPMDWSCRVHAGGHVLSTGLAFVTFEHEGPFHSSALHDPRIHMSLNFTRDAVNVQSGRVDVLPRLEGISGCGIWHVGELARSGIVARSEESVTLIGIQHSWLRTENHQYIHATRVGCVLDMIRLDYPETEKPMTLAYPAG